MAMLCRGTMEERLELAFSMFDADSNGFIEEKVVVVMSPVTLLLFLTVLLSAGAEVSALASGRSRKSWAR